MQHQSLGDLTADFNWAFGENHSGGFRWQVEVMYNGNQQNIMVDYGNAAASLQGGTDGSGVNMIGPATATDNRDESTQVGGTLYTPWSYVTSNFGSLPVVGVDLVVDGGWGHVLPGGTYDQVINLTDANVGWNGGSSTFTFPAPVVGGAVDPTSVPMYVYLLEVNGTTPGQVVDEQITSTQGDSGGQYRTADGMYMYNFPVRNLPDKTATYKIGISPNSDGSSPFAAVPFGTK